MDRAKYIKLKKKKFIRNVIIGTISVAIIAYILNTAQGFRRDTFGEELNLTINARNLTERLTHEIYIDNNGTIFLSIEDIENLFDSTIYHNEDWGKIVTTADTKIAILDFETNEMIENGVAHEIASSAIRRGEAIYIPISEMERIYNIRVEFFEGNKVVAIEELNREMIVANINRDVALRFRSRRLSRNVEDLTVGERVRGFNLTYTGWRQIQTEEGQIRICKR